MNQIEANAFVVNQKAAKRLVLSAIYDYMDDDYIPNHYDGLRSQMLILADPDTVELGNVGISAEGETRSLDRRILFVLVA